MLYLRLHSTGRILAGPFTDREAAQEAIPVIGSALGSERIEAVSVPAHLRVPLNHLVRGLHAPVGTRVPHRRDRERYVLPDMARWKVERRATSRPAWTVVPA